MKNHILFKALQNLKARVSSAEFATDRGDGGNRGQPATPASPASNADAAVESQQSVL